MLIKLSKGLDIPMQGTPEPVIDAGSAVRSVALLGGDYVGLKPKMLIEAGEKVTLGQALFIDKRDPAVPYTAPGSGVVRSINRGTRRALQSVIIELDEPAEDTAAYSQLAASKPASLTPEVIRSALHTSGLWTAFRTRPYNKVPDSGSAPRSIFVTAIDTRPLAGNPEPVIGQHHEEFLQGLKILACLTDGNVNVCTSASWELTLNEDQQIRHARFSGPHPAGLPGTHIHHLDPVGSSEMVWHIGYQDVIAIGHLFSSGRILCQRTIALGGTGFTRPRMVTTRLGACVADLVSTELIDRPAQPQRLLSGCALDGRIATDTEGFLGRYHLQLTTINDQAKRKLFGWLGLFNGDFSFASRLARRQGHATFNEFSTQQFGRPTALVPIDAFDRVMPMDILPVPLLRALLIRDTDQAQALGCLELDSEDLALCSFICPGKNNYGAALKINLEQIERDG
jgi:Na+-transporting NADH:ubiquinone oxidoreductase subunit A